MDAEGPSLVGVRVLPEESGGELLGLCLPTGWGAVLCQYSLQCIPDTDPSIPCVLILCFSWVGGMDQVYALAVYRRLLVLSWLRS